MDKTAPFAYRPRFEAYFARPVASAAAEPLKEGTEMEFRVGEETPEVFAFVRTRSGNEVRQGPAKDADVVFSMRAAAAEEILSDPSEDIGSIGVAIAKKILSDDPDRRVHVEIRAGFFTLLRHGYFGVVALGGKAFASYLASRGFNGMSALKAALKRGKG